jgi:heme/copper-type cytochrome/quinol oxidase subunit 2
MQWIISNIQWIMASSAILALVLPLLFIALVSRRAESGQARTTEPEALRQSGRENQEGLWTKAGVVAGIISAIVAVITVWKLG